MNRTGNEGSVTFQLGGARPLMRLVPRLQCGGAIGTQNAPLLTAAPGTSVDPKSRGESPLPFLARFKPTSSSFQGSLT